MDVCHPLPADWVPLKPSENRHTIRVLFWPTLEAVADAQYLNMRYEADRDNYRFDHPHVTKEELMEIGEDIR